MIARLILILSIIASVNARCDNACSGHGTCNIKSLCECYDNFGMGENKDHGDCSDRICPYDVSFADKPDKSGNHHKYAECSDAGICNRATGECACYSGYEGPACQRISCPNSCSGHGVCVLLEDLTYEIVGSGDYNFQDPKVVGRYDGWDKSKFGACVCDPEYGDIDCSKRLCPYGADVMDVRNDLDKAQKYQVQQFTLIQDHSLSGALNMDGLSFALTFTSKIGQQFTTVPITIYTAAGEDEVFKRNFDEFLESIETALEELPNDVIDDVKVQGSHNGNGNIITINVTFVGNTVQGNQHLLGVVAYECLDGCTPKITGLPLQPGLNETIKELVSADYTSYECGRRGKCDYTSGLCNCYAGYTGVSCGTITALV